MRKTTIRSIIIGAGAGLFAIHAQAQSPIAQWDFESGTLAATLGGDITYIDGVGGVTEQGTAFGTTTSFGIPDVNGTPAKVMKIFAGADLSQGYYIPIEAQASDGGSLLNSYSLVMDLLYPSTSDAKWRTLLDADNGALEADGEFFINPANGLGVNGNYSGNVAANTWYRIGVVVDGANNQIRKYINGVLVGTQDADGVDGRFALQPGGTAGLFTDNDGDTAVGYANSIQLYDQALTSANMAALGTPTAAGLPQTIPSAPSFIASTIPAAGDAAASPLPVLTAVIDQGSTTIDPASVKLSLDGTDLPAVASKNGSQVTISNPITTALLSKSEHTASVRYVDSVAGAKTNTWSFTVADFKSVTLPAPVWIETFDSTPEGSLPNGWSVTNNTENATGTYDLTDASSDAYLDWVVLNMETFKTVFGADNSRLQFPPIIVNGQLLSSLVSSNFIYAESDRRGGSQVQVLFSPDVNLSGRTNIYLSYHSMYAQNQDSIGSVEYSIDQGATWQPVVYMIDTPDVITKEDGTVDGYATLSLVHDDAAYGTSYGTYVGVASNRWSEVGPYISARIDDDQMESKRVELFRLPLADNQAHVRLRFMQAGTGSWYFGVDDVGLYSIEQTLPPTIKNQPQSTLVSAGSSVTLSVIAEGSGNLSYQWKLADNNLSGATSSTYTINNASTANSGIYTVTISNAGGSVTSDPAKIEVFSGSITQDLVVHLKFDNSLDDSSGRTNNATAMGASDFGQGIIGSSAHIPSGADYITLGAPEDLNFGVGTDFTISFWALMKEWSGDASFVGNKDWNSGSNQGYVIATDDDGHLQWNVAGAPGGRKDYDGPPGILSDTNWHLITISFDRQGNAATYVDGAKVDSRPVAGNLNDLSTPTGQATNIGQDGTGNYGSAFTDLNVDDLGIWRRALTPQEIASIYAHGQAGEDLTKAVVDGGGSGDPGSVTASRSGSQLTLNWTGGAGITLQEASSLTNPTWTDVANTTGSSTATVQTSGKAGFFRLIKR